MKKVLALLLVAVMALGFVGCGKSAGGEVPTLVWYLPGEKQEDIQMVCDEINKILEPKIGAKLDIQYITSSDFSERLRLIMAAQEPFDLCFTGFTNPYLDGVRRGGFYELSDLLKEYGKELESSIPDYLWDAVKMGDEIYAVPCYQAMTKCAAIYFNKDLVEKYNFDTSKVKKLADIRPFLEIIRDNEKGNVFPMVRPNIDYFLPDIYKYQDTSINFVKINRDTKEVIFVYDIPEYEQARKTIKEWNDAGFFNPNANDTARTQDAACWITNGYRPGDVVDRERQNGFEIIAVPISEYVIGRSTATTTMTAISATSRYPEKAMELIVELNTNPELFNLCAYGIEDIHYTKTGENHIKIIKGSGYVPEGNWKYGNMFVGYMMDGYEDGLWETLKEINDNATKDILLGFIADVDPVTIPISNIATAMSEYAEVSNGTSKDLEGKVKEMNEKLEKAGKKELMDYAKKVVGEYLDKKGIK